MMNIDQKYLVGLIKGMITNYPSSFREKEFPDLYDIVLHCGKPSQSKRVGWMGMVISKEFEPIVVHWFCSSPTTTLSEVVPQQYTERWASANLKYMAPLSRSPKEHLDLAHAVEGHILSMTPPHLLESSVVVNSKKGEGSFLLWSPLGIRNPKKIHTTYNDALAAAKSMSVKHGQEFFVCKLVASASCKVTKVTHVEVNVLC